ncbi:MAG TPA: Hsp20/alpha crystallin family protein [Hyphomicrobiaceae bacterium]|nr:Hsp20/alpha crystallin family protein [Hyphomicrobiaceae bacterium]
MAARFHGGYGDVSAINVFQQGDDFVALIELPGVSKDDIENKAKDRSIRLSGKKTISFQDTASVHRRERVSGVFDRTITLPVQLDVDRLKAEMNSPARMLVNEPATRARSVGHAARASLSRLR